MWNICGYFSRSKGAREQQLEYPALRCDLFGYLVQYTDAGFMRSRLCFQNLGKKFSPTSLSPDSYKIALSSSAVHFCMSENEFT